MSGDIPKVIPRYFRCPSMHAERAERINAKPTCRSAGTIARLALVIVGPIQVDPAIGSFTTAHGPAVRALTPHHQGRRRGDTCRPTTIAALRAACRRNHSQEHSLNYHVPYRTHWPEAHGVVVANRPEARHLGGTLTLPLRLILCTLFIPQELSFFVAGLRFTYTRLLLIVLTPVLFVNLVRKMCTGRYRFVLSDVFAPAAALWMFVGPGASFGFGDSFVHSGPVAVEFLSSYMATRVLLSGNGDALQFVRVLCIAIAIVSVDGVLDTSAGYYVTRQFAAQVSHYSDIAYNADSVRFGLLRASGTLEHPILFGFTAAIGLIFSCSGRFTGRAICLAASAVGLVISLSSAPQQCGAMGVCLLVYSRMTRNWKYKWLLLAAPPTAIAIALLVSTETPFGHIISLTTLDPSTAYYRLYIWNMVGPAILNNPLFAILPNAYDYQGSVDSVWLALSLSYGMICSIFVALTILGSCSIPTNGGRSGLSTDERDLATAVGIMLFLVIFMGFTVDFWGSVWILVGLLIGLRAHLGELARVKSETGLRF